MLEQSLSPRPGSPRNRGERASSVLMVAMVVMGLTACLVAARVAGTVSSAARAQSVADVSALAGAARGTEAAGVVAGANGARLVELRRLRGSTVAMVSLEDSTAVAAAVACLLPPGAESLPHRDGVTSMRCR